MENNVETIKELRARTSAGVMDCKRALEESEGDMDRATSLLKEWGISAVQKKSSRDANQGVVETYIHAGGRIGVILELNCETDFVARTPDFQALAHDIAMQVAAMAPDYLDESEKEEGDDRPAAQVCLLNQPFIKGGSSVAEVVQEMAAKVGENVRVVRFSRLALGE